jgi:hypothetical protein
LSTIVSFPAGQAELPPQRAVIHQRGDRIPQRAGIFRRHEDAGLPMHNSFNEAARLEADDWHAGRCRLQRRYAQPLRERWMDKDVEAADVIIEVFTEAREGDDVRNPQRLRLRL